MDVAVGGGCAKRAFQSIGWSVEYDKDVELGSMVVIVDGLLRLDSAKACFTRFSSIPTRSFKPAFSASKVAIVPSGKGCGGTSSTRLSSGDRQLAGRLAALSRGRSNLSGVLDAVSESGVSVLSDAFSASSSATRTSRYDRCTFR